MRGDRPCFPKIECCLFVFTPHARGSTPGWLGILSTRWVYPACAGIDLLPFTMHLACVSLPRMRGDRPCGLVGYVQFKEFTPHARGSTFVERIFSLFFFVYPACAGIDPRGRKKRRKGKSLPRMRGDRPRGILDFPKKSKFTPHVRGSTTRC